MAFPHLSLEWLYWWHCSWCWLTFSTVWGKFKDHIYRMVKVKVQQYLTKPNQCIWPIRTHYTFVSTNDYIYVVKTTSAGHSGLQLLPSYMYMIIGDALFYQSSSLAMQEIQYYLHSDMSIVNNDIKIMTLYVCPKYGDTCCYFVQIILQTRMKQDFLLHFLWEHGSFVLHPKKVWKMRRNSVTDFKTCSHLTRQGIECETCKLLVTIVENCLLQK